MSERRLYEPKKLKFVKTATAYYAIRWKCPGTVTEFYYIIENPQNNECIPYGAGNPLIGEGTTLEKAIEACQIHWETFGFLGQFLNRVELPESASDQNSAYD